MFGLNGPGASAAESHCFPVMAGGFHVPADRCATYGEKPTGGVALKRDMLQHLPLENNILLQRSQSLIAGQSGK